MKDSKKLFTASIAFILIASVFFYFGNLNAMEMTTAKIINEQMALYSQITIFVLNPILVLSSLYTVFEKWSRQKEYVYDLAKGLLTITGGSLLLLSIFYPLMLSFKGQVPSNVFWIIGFGAIDIPF